MTRNATALIKTAAHRLLSRCFLTELIIAAKNDRDKSNQAIFAADAMLTVQNQIEK
jgi:hypothetical protein